MKSITYLTSLILLLLNNTIEGTTINIDPASLAGNSAPQASVPAADNNKQSVVSTCHAVRAVMGHDGEIAQWKAKCRIEVWTDKDQPEMKDLSSDQRAKVLSELASQPASVTAGSDYREMFDKSRYLAEEATNRHNLCMEAKRSILYQLKLQLPAGLTSCEKITQVMNDLKLTPELEAFIDQVNGPMKEQVAKIHAIEQNTTLPEMVKMEAIRAAKTELTTMLDENCKDDHPSIRYHNVGYMPNPDLGKVKMTLVVSHPDKRVVYFNLPEETFGPHIQNLKDITEAAVHHGQATGQQGLFEGIHQTANGDSSVTSFIPAKVPEANSQSASSVSTISTKSIGAGSASSSESVPALSAGLDSELNAAASVDTSNTVASMNTSSTVASDISVSNTTPSPSEAANVTNLSNSSQSASNPALSGAGTTVIAAGEGVANTSPPVAQPVQTLTISSEEAALNAQIKSFAVQITAPEAPGTDSAAIENFLKSVNFGAIPEKTDGYSPSTENYWRKKGTIMSSGIKYQDLSPEQKAVELPYQQKKEVLTRLRSELKARDTKGKINLFSTSFSDQVYSFGKKYIDDERKKGKDALDANTSAIVTTPVQATANQNPGLFSFMKWGSSKKA